jgi:hypothetical protein
MTSRWIRSLPGGVEITVRVTPRASRTAILGETPEALRIAVQAPPLDDRANRALTEFLAERLECPRGAVGLRAGARGRLKRLVVMGLTEAEVRRRLGEAGRAD